MRGLSELEEANTKQAIRGVVRALEHGRITVGEAQELLSPWPSGPVTVYSLHCITGADLDIEREREKVRGRLARVYPAGGRLGPRC